MKEEYIFYRRNGKLMRFPKNGKTTLFRGLTQEYDPDYDKSKLDNPNGYESWTDSYDLAKEYAGENGYVYSTEVPNKDLNTEDIFDENGDRSLVYWNDKPVALHGVEGEEFMVYTEHEDHDKLDYKEITSPSKEEKEVINYKNYENDLGEVDEDLFKKENASIILKEPNRSTEAWTTDDGSYESNHRISKYLRDVAEGNSNRNDRMEKAVEDLENLMNPSDKPFTMFRTTQEPLSKINVGDIIDKDSFIDGSLSRKYSVLHFNYGDAYSTTIELQVPEGTRALYIGDKTSYKENEYEVLLGKGYGIEITNIEKEFDKDGDYMNTIVKGKVVPYKNSQIQENIVIDKNSNDFKTIQELMNNLFK